MFATRSHCEVRFFLDYEMRHEICVFAGPEFTVKRFVFHLYRIILYLKILGPGNDTVREKSGHMCAGAHSRTRQLVVPTYMHCIPILGLRPAVKFHTYMHACAHAHEQQQQQP